MQNFINQIKGTIRGLKNKRKWRKKIIELKENRKGQKCRLKKDNEKEEKIVKEKKILEKRK